MSALPTTPAAPTVNPVDVAGQIAQALPLKGDAKLAVSSFTPTGEPVSTALLSIGRFIFGKSAQGKEEKQARLVASTSRDMGITGGLAQFIQEFFDPSDAGTQALLEKARQDLAITDPKDTQRGDRQHAISQAAIPLYARQLMEGRAALPNPSELRWTPGESSEAISRTIISGIAVQSLSEISKARFGKDVNEFLREKTGRPEFDIKNSTRDFFDLFNFLGFLGNIGGEKNAQPTEKVSIQNSGGGFSGSPSVQGLSGGTDRIIPQTIVQKTETPPILLFLMVAGVGLVAYSILANR